MMNPSITRYPADTSEDTLGYDVATREVLPDTQVLLAEWYAFLEASFSPRTADGYSRHVERFLRHAKKPLLELGEQGLVDFLNTYPPRSASRQGIYYACRSLWTWLRRKGYVVFDITESVPAPKVPERDPRALSEGELIRLLDAAIARHPMRGATLLLLYYTGMRVSEACSLLWSDITNGFIYVREGKGAKDRVIPVSDALRSVLDVLANHRNGDGRVLPRVEGTIWQWCKRAGEDAGIRKVHPHLFRSTMLTTLLNRGVAIHHARKLAGHTNIRTTSRYLAITDQDMRAAVDVL